jgi:UTP-glucose-1-phosphate uridylyltransferase
MPVRHTKRNNRVFLDIPYKSSYIKYERVIRAALIAYGLEPVVAKDSKKTTNLLDDVVELIQSSKYAVVDISGLNFNVGFEAGYLQALGRKFILLKDKKTKPPADLRGLKSPIGTAF